MNNKLKYFNCPHHFDPSDRTDIYEGKNENFFVYENFLCPNQYMYYPEEEETTFTNQDQACSRIYRQVRVESNPACSHTTRRLSCLGCLFVVAFVHFSTTQSVEKATEA